MFLLYQENGQVESLVLNFTLFVLHFAFLQKKDPNLSNENGAG